MTPRLEKTLAAALAAGAMLLTAAAFAQSSDQEFAGALAAVSAQASAGAAKQKSSPAAAAPSIPTLLAARAAPDFGFTPGHLCSPSDPNFKEYRYPEHIAYCQRNVTQQMKQTVGAHYNVAQSQWSSYEFDHLIPLAIGGDSSVDNLWPQPHDPGTGDGSEGKDKLEDNLYQQMKAGTITQAAAVQQIYDWFKAAAMAADASKVAAR